MGVQYLWSQVGIENDPNCPPGHHPTIVPGPSSGHHSGVEQWPSCHSVAKYSPINSSMVIMAFIIVRPAAMGEGGSDIRQTMNISLMLAGVTTVSPPPLPYHWPGDTGDSLWLVSSLVTHTQDTAVTMWAVSPQPRRTENSFSRSKGGIRTDFHMFIPCLHCMSIFFISENSFQ